MSRPPSEHFSEEMDAFNSAEFYGLDYSQDLEQEALRHMQVWTNFSKQDNPWADFSTLEVAASLPCTYSTVLQNDLT